MTMRRLDPPAGPFRSDRHVPGDKSLSHRALIFAAMAEGTSEVEYLGTGRDVAATRAAIARLGVEVEGTRLTSPGVQGWRPPDGAG